MRNRIALVDDQQPDLDRLKQDILEIIPADKKAALTVHTYPSGEAFLKEFRPGVFQLVFLDIYMTGMTGITLAGKLREADPSVLLVFTTSSREHAFDAFPLHPFDYLVKPYRKEALAHVLTEAERVLALPEPAVTVRAAYNTLSVPLSRIVSVMSCGHSVEIHTTDRQVIRSIMTFAELASLLADDPRFLACNRGILVNMDHVLSLDKDVFLMKSGPSCALRVRDRARLVASFTQYQISRMKKGLTE